MVIVILVTVNESGTRTLHGEVPYESQKIWGNTHGVKQQYMLLPHILPPIVEPMIFGLCLANIRSVCFQILFVVAQCSIFL